METSFQARLAARQNKIAKKLIDNKIRLSGIATDCIKVTAKTTDQGDIISRKVESLDVVSVIFPALEDIPIRKILHSSGVTITIPYSFENQPFEVLIPSTSKVDHNDILVKYYENESNEDPYLAIYQVKDMLGTFGARSIVYAKYKLTIYDGELPQKIIDWAVDMAKRRSELKW